MSTAALSSAVASAAPVRRVAIAGVTVAAGVALYVALGGSASTLTSALDRAIGAQPGWLAIAVAAEVVSIAGYVALFGLVTGVDGRTAYRISLAGTAATRLLPTAGAGGVAFTVWALREHAAAAGALVLRFLTVLYAVFLSGLLVAAVLAAAGGRTWALLPAAAAGAALAMGLVLGLRRGADAPLELHLGRRAITVPRLGPEVRAAARLVTEHDPRLAGALLWWLADAAVLGLTFAAVGAEPGVTLLLFVYFLGTVANTVPVPGAMSGGLIGVAVLSGIDPAAAIAAVVVYRAIAMWLPTPFGAVALLGLRASEARQGALG